MWIAFHRDTAWKSWPPEQYQMVGVELTRASWEMLEEMNMDVSSPAREPGLWCGACVFTNAPKENGQPATNALCVWKMAGEDDECGTEDRSFHFWVLTHVYYLQQLRASIQFQSRRNFQAWFPLNRMMDSSACGGEFILLWWLRMKNAAAITRLKGRCFLLLTHQTYFFLSGAL